MANNIIADGDHVIFKRDGTCRVFQIKPDRQAYFEKVKFTVNDLIGQPFGSTFKVDRGNLVKLSETKVLELEQVASEPGADNRNLLDSESNQKMRLEDIQKMKSDGLSGEKIIEELVENSETFDSKTSFSQAKYLKKKKKKHLQMFTVLKPTARLVMEIFSKEPAKICFLRPDTVSQILNFSNVMYGSNVAVVETCQGLVLACVLERLGGHGKVIHIVPNTSDTLCRQVMNYFNFTKDQLDNFYSVPITCLKVETDGIQHKSLNINSSTEIPRDTLMSYSRTELPAIEMLPDRTDDVNEAEKSDIMTEEKEAEKKKREVKREEKQKRQEAAAAFIQNKKLDSLIIACKYNPLPVVKKLIQFLPPSRCVVVYCQYIEPLVECYAWIKEQQVGCQLKFSETWCRDYQVLPNQTHPVINMSGTGGYLLTYTTVSKLS
ncbi:tRNA (adenine(58)-N(1))-methyltransferase non-catalytic subunit TRM6 [Biomphalaria pfeifferi]|uniref:tRNA (adenine(58)-N(1))-methyltransferase non-catalytic subunit TRM6 n=1 Tax=Biomphalaria pfeifferi TaxID=112525 RepID=A0AAD8BLY8_BIOPF|nr:tRNA (adenine(58)-N(1))-methyltransferase non-catalytic subunit TRM6 [Biomphalaria pfeifferi]